MRKNKIDFFNKKKFADPFVIAEIGVNHECSLKKAKQLINQAKQGGAHAVKFQTYKADMLVSKKAKAYWNTKEEKIKNQHELFKKYDKFEKEDYVKLFNFCKNKKIIFLSTPFDFQAVDDLDKLVPFYKIASADITNLPLIQYIASKKKPIILSTGASNLDEIKKAVNLIKREGVQKICLMHCILNYPTKKKDANLLMISHLAKTFPNFTIGYSDHTKPEKMESLITAYICGAKIIEKHFTNNKKLKGNDHYHSMDKNDLKYFFKQIDIYKKILGSSDKKKPIKSENISRKFARRSLILNNFLKKGSRIKKKDLICKRPGTGISPYYINQIIGKKIKKNLYEDHILKYSDLI